MEGSADLTPEHLALHNLHYATPPKLGITQQGSIFKRHYADQATYESNKSTEIIITLQASTDFVYGRNSYIMFDVKAEGLDSEAGTLLGFRNTPATALFERFMLESKDGAELERIEDLNKLVRNVLPWKYPNDYTSNVATMAGMYPNKSVGNSTTSPDDANYALNKIGTATDGLDLRVTIPLWFFSGVFNEETLIPPSMISGMRLRLTLAPALEALTLIATDDGKAPTTPVGTDTTYTISNPMIVTENYSMAPAVMKNLMEQMASAEGLPFAYETYYNQKANPATSAEYNLQINKAVARAQSLWIVTQKVIADTLDVDNLGTAIMPYYQYQTRIGDWYAPQQKMQLGVTDTIEGVRKNCAELYLNNLQCTGGIRDPYYTPAISFDNFRSVYGLSSISQDYVTSTNGGFAVIAQTLNQSHSLEKCGLAVNNSRTCETTIRYNATFATTSKLITAFLCYVKVAHVYNSRTVVKQ